MSQSHHAGKQTFVDSLQRFVAIPVARQTNWFGRRDVDLSESEFHRRRRLREVTLDRYTENAEHCLNCPLEIGSEHETDPCVMVEGGKLELA